LWEVLRCLRAMLSLRGATGFTGSGP